MVFFCFKLITCHIICDVTRFSTEFARARAACFISFRSGSRSKIDARAHEFEFATTMLFLLMFVYTTTTMSAVDSSNVLAVSNHAGNALHVACVNTCVCSYSRYQGVTVKCVAAAVRHNDSNRVPDLGGVLSKLPANTRNLYLLHKRLEGLPQNSLRGLYRLRDLYLSYNHLSDYESWSRAMDYDTASHLSHLGLSHNHLQIIWSRAFRNFIMLRSLDLSANSISIIHRDAFVGLESLLLLDLRNNSLTNVKTTSFRNLQTLQQLFLEYNKVESIEMGTFKPLKHLQTLSLVGNKLKSVYIGMFTGLYNLQQLHLSNNLIEKIAPYAIEELSNLTELWLDGNQLVSLDSGLKTSFQRMNYGPVNLGHNPFVCDCHLLWLASWIHQQEIVMSGSDVTVPYPECLSPTQHYGKFIHNVEFKDFQCTNASYHPSPCMWASKDFVSSYNNCSYLTLSICTQNGMALNDSVVHANVSSSCLCDVDATVCYVCPPGSYGRHATDVADVECTPCPPLKGSRMGTEEERDCQCLPGFYSSNNNDSCTACPVGYFKSELGPQPCRACQAGSITTRLGAIACECLPGFQLDHLGHCEPCPKSTYKAHAGPHRCRPCPDHSTSPEKSTSIDQCRCLYAQARMGMLSSPHRVCLGPNESLHQISMESPLHEREMHLSPTNANIHTVIVIFLSVTFLVLMSFSIVVITQKMTNRRTKKQLKMTEARKAQIVQICIPQPVEDAWICTNLSSWEISSECLTLGPLLGQGAFGQVYQAHLQRDAVVTKVAVKCCRDGPASEEQEALWSELKLLIYVGKHQNIVNLIGTAFQQGSLMLVLEYAIYGDLLTFLRAKTTSCHYAYHQQQQQEPLDALIVLRPQPLPSADILTPQTLNDRLNGNMINNTLYEPSPVESSSPSSLFGHPSRLTTTSSPPTRSTSTSVSNNSSKNTVSTLVMTTSAQNGNHDSSSISEILLLSIAWQIAKGMRHLEQLKCIHRDLAARNILLGESMVAKISDFGLAREAYECGYYFRQSRGRLPFKWMALETLFQGQFTNKSDVWSYGIVLWEMMTFGANPYPGVPLNSLMDLLVSGYRMHKPEGCREDIYQVMRSCWKEIPTDRPTFTRLCDIMDDIVQKSTNRDYLVVDNTEVPGSESTTE